MINPKHNMMTINKAPALMLTWGLTVLLASLVNQFFELPNPNYTLILWGALSILGIVGQVLCYISGLKTNYLLWIGLIIVGWLFTLYVFKFDNGANIALLADLPAVWLALIGVGYVATAIQVDRRFYYIAAVTFLVAIIMELSARRIVSIDFVDEYAALIFGLTVSIPLFVASSSRYYRPKKKAVAPPITEATPASPSA